MVGVQSIVIAFIVCVISPGSMGSYKDEELLPRIYLDVYYENNCPDSENFIINQLQPAIDSLHEFIILKLVPFGKSASNPDGTFTCQHGPEACHGNMIQDCALANMLNRPDQDMLGYVVCEIKTKSSILGNTYCMDQFKVPVDKVLSCVSWGDGLDLQFYSERLTASIKPKYIPAITIDGIFDQRIQDNAQVDLMGTLCSILGKTRACAFHFNKIAMKFLMQSNNLLYFSQMKK